jgi:hypothetical protein
MRKLDIKNLIIEGHQGASGLDLDVRQNRAKHRVGELALSILKGFRPPAPKRASFLSEASPKKRLFFRSPGEVKEFNNVLPTLFVEICRQNC